MEKVVTTLLVIFFTAALLALQASSAPLDGCNHKELHKPPTNPENPECEYHLSDKRALIDGILEACGIIIGTTSDIHRELLGAKSLVSN